MRKKYICVLSFRLFRAHNVFLCSGCCIAFECLFLLGRFMISIVIVVDVYIWQMVGVENSLADFVTLLCVYKGSNIIFGLDHSI